MSRSHFLDHLRDYLPNHERAAFRASYGFKSVSTGLSVVLSGVNPMIAAATALSLRRFRPKTVAQMALYQLAGRRARQLGLEIDRAHLIGDKCVRQNWINSLSSALPARPMSCGCTTALTSSPISSFGTPNTATSATSGWVISTSSVSCG